MIEMQRLNLPDVVDRAELETWRRSLPRRVADHCPQEVRDFIQAVSQKLPDFERYQVESTLITGAELMLCNMHEYKGERIRAGMAYPIEVPRMQAVDHFAAMHRIYHRKGKQGLIDYVKARVEGSRLQQLLEILNVHVFHQERPEFQKVMDKIKEARKLEPVL